MDGFIARRDVLSFTEVRKLSERSDLPGLIQLASHLAALCVTGALVWLALGTWWLLIPAWLVHGTLLNFLFCPLHETIHRTPFRSKWLNDAVANLTGFIMLLPPVYFRCFHFDHHRYTQIPGKDPELIEPKPAGFWSWAWYMTGLQSYWWAESAMFVRHALGRVNAPFVPEDGKAAVILEARIYLALYIAIIAGSVALSTWAAVIWWAVPIVLASFTLRAYLMAEHTLLPHTDDMLINTRTTHSNALVRWMAWQMPYHCEHHTFPTIPFHALKATHGRIADRLGATSPGYIHFTARLLKSFHASPAATPESAPR